ncbi:MAG TPA: hypothetical protein VFB58_08150 [Chloroflexota bacterium]|nr:hypothetical protein [Chloroflexota bacterium]
MAGRKARRRAERQRQKRHERRAPSSPVRRVVVIAFGLVAIVAGVALITHGTSAQRLARLAGILIVVGAAAILAGALGWV